MSSTDTITGVATTFAGSLTDQLWAIAPIGLGIAAILWGVPKGIGFVKKLGK